LVNVVVNNRVDHSTDILGFVIFGFIAFFAALLFLDLTGDAVGEENRMMAANPLYHPPASRGCRSEIGLAAAYSLSAFTHTLSSDGGSHFYHRIGCGVNGVEVVIHWVNARLSRALLYLNLFIQWLVL
jgi:hypothetical protein